MARCPSLLQCPCPGSHSELSVLRARSVLIHQLRPTVESCCFCRCAVPAVDRQGSEGLCLESSGQRGGRSWAECGQDWDQLGGEGSACVVHAQLERQTPGQT